MGARSEKQSTLQIARVASALQLAGSAEAEGQAALAAALKALPQSGRDLNNLGVLAHELGNNEAAIAILRQSLAVRPDHAETHCNLAVVLRALDRHEEAVEACQRAVTLDPTLAKAHNIMGWALQKLERTKEAIDAFQKALELDVGFVETSFIANLGTLLADIGRLDEAIALFRFAVQIDPTRTDAACDLGRLLCEKGRPEDALAVYQQALAVAPTPIPALHAITRRRRWDCQWTNLDADEAPLLELLRQATVKTRLEPFPFLATAASAADLLRCAQAWAEGFSVPPGSRFVHSAARRQLRPGERIRIGYLSADYYNHATTILITELIEKHDRTQFEVIGYSTGQDDGSLARKRIIKAFDRFVELNDRTDAEAARAIYQDKVDILVDLKGYTTDARTQILAWRPAPIQVNYLGYPGAMGADFIDYVIGDPIVTPLNDQPHFSETILQLPHCYQPNDRHRQIAERTPSRSQCGLPENGIVLCCFNANYKITPVFFDIWMRLLMAVPGSVLWLIDSGTASQQNLRKEAAARGVDPRRLVFAPKVSVPDHLARHRLADLFLDTLPYNAHTTASDALWAGLPVVTCMGDRFSGRVGASLVIAAGLPQLVTTSLREYEETALRLAQSPAELAAIKRELEQNRMSCALFDIETYTHDLEALFTRMIEDRRARAG